MPDRNQTYRNQVSDAVDAWRANVCNQYIIAYNNAYKSYVETFGKQKESDKARAELFVSIAALLPGSILMAAAATSSLRVVAHRAALRVLCHRRAEAALRVYNAVAPSATAKFALGKTLDLVKDQTGKKIQDALVQAVTKSQDLLAVDPLNRDKQLDTWLTNHKLLAYDAAALIDADRSMSEADREQAYAGLRLAPIANKPIGKLDPAALAPKIELGLYMVWLLDSDELVTQVASGGPYGGGKFTSKPIQTMPSDTANYPKANSDSRRGPIQWVGVTRPGGDIEDRIDVLNKQLRGRVFYEAKGWLGRSDAGQIRVKEVAAAERVLLALSASTQPMSPLGVGA